MRKYQKDQLLLVFLALKLTRLQNYMVNFFHPDLIGHFSTKEKNSVRKIMYWAFERTERSESGDEVAFCSSTGGFAFLFDFPDTILWHLQETSNAFISKPGRESVHFLRRLGHDTNTESLHKVFGQNCFFLAEKIGNLVICPLRLYTLTPIY